MSREKELGTSQPSRLSLVAAAAIGGVCGAFVGTLYGGVTDVVMQPVDRVEIGAAQPEFAESVAERSDTFGESSDGTLVGMRFGMLAGAVGGSILGMAEVQRQHNHKRRALRLKLPPHPSEGPDGSWQSF